MTIEEYKALKKKPKFDIALDLLKKLASQASWTALPGLAQETKHTPTAKQN
jgi:hypothetical protein